MNETEGRQILSQQRVERDIADSRTCAQIADALQVTGRLRETVEIVPVAETHTLPPTPDDQRPRGGFFVPYAGL